MKNPCSEYIHPAILKSGIVVMIPIAWFLFIIVSTMFVIGVMLMIPFMRCEHDASNDTWNWKAF